MVIQLRIDGATPLSGSLTNLLDSALDQAEDLGENAALLVHVAGHRNQAVAAAWPGTTSLPVITKWERALRRCERAAATTIVLAEDTCSALALDLLLVADRRLANHELIIELTAAGGGRWPGMALFRLANQIGYARARKLLMFGTELTAAQAVESVIVDATVRGLPGALEHAAQLLAAAPCGELAMCRRLLQDSLFTSFDDALGAHLAACDRLLRLDVNQQAARDARSYRE